jgi:hypothetical protein
MRPQAAEKIPHSWPISEWPLAVYPNNPERAKYIVRVHLNSLIKAGALTRIGRELVVMGAGYSAWLATNADRVDNFEIAANRDRATRKGLAAAKAGTGA